MSAALPMPSPCSGQHVNPLYKGNVMKEKLRDLLRLAKEFQNFVAQVEAYEEADEADIEHLETLVGECSDAVDGLRDHLDGIDLDGGEV